MDQGRQIVAPDKEKKMSEDKWLSAEEVKKIRSKQLPIDPQFPDLLVYQLDEDGELTAVKVKDDFDPMEGEPEWYKGIKHD